MNLSPICGNGSFLSISPCQSKTILIALEIIFGLAVTGAALYLMHFYGINTIGALAGTGGGGIFLIGGAIATTLYCLKKTPKIDVTPSEQKPQVVEGTISIPEHRQVIVGVLGSDPTALNALTKKVKRIDGKDWTQFKNEILIEFSLDIQGPNPVPSKILLLPLCLFINNEDYYQVKENGEVVKFDYEGTRFCLTINQKNLSFQAIIEKFINALYEQRKKRKIINALPVRFPLKEIPSYFFPREIQEHQRLVEEAEQLKFSFSKFFPSSQIELSLPISPKTNFYLEQFLLAFPVGDDCNLFIYFYSNTHLAIYAKGSPLPKSKKITYGRNGVFYNPKEFPAFASKEYLFILEFSETLTREMVEQAKKDYKGGVLNITFPKKLSAATVTKQEGIWHIKREEPAIQGTIFISSVNTGPIRGDRYYNFGNRIQDENRQPLIVGPEDIYVKIDGTFTKGSQAAINKSAKGLSGPIFLPSTLFMNAKEGSVIYFYYDGQLVELKCCQFTENRELSFEDAFSALVQSVQQDSIQALLAKDMDRKSQHKKQYYEKRTKKKTALIS